MTAEVAAMLVRAVEHSALAVRHASDDPVEAGRDVEGGLASSSLRLDFFFVLV